MPFEKRADAEQTQTTTFKKNADTLHTQTTLIHEKADISQVQTDCRQPCLFNSDYNLDQYLGDQHILIKATVEIENLTIIPILSFDYPILEIT